MRKISRKSSSSTLTKRELETLLQGQTTTILDAVDSRIGKLDGKIDKLDDKMVKEHIALRGYIDKRIEEAEERFNKKLDQLTTTLDRFLKRLTDMDDEFVIMKKEVRQIKLILREKLGVSIP